MLPTNAPPNGNGTTAMGKKRPGGNTISTNTWLMVLGASAISFLAGNLSASSFNTCSSLSSPALDMQNERENAASISRREEVVEVTRETSPARKGALFPETVKKFAQGLGRVPKSSFTDTFELGVPIDLPGPGSEEVLILYNSKNAMPNSHKRALESTVHQINSAEEATENCDHLNMIFTDFEGRRRQCIAVIPQYESYHIQKWMRIDPTAKKPAIDANANLHLVGRGFQANGIDSFKPPNFERHTKKAWEMFRTYLDSLDDVLAELKPIVDKVKKKNTVIVMVCNHGQSELLVNFACSTHSRGLDISNIIVFATDEETKELAESVGLAAYYDERNFGHIGSKAAGQYGDKQFTQMMMAKVVCVQLIGLLGVDILFQDVDIVWYKDPMDVFHDKNSPIYFYDMYYQDDGSHSTRYAPYAPNSGFYYIRNNPKTVYFMNSLLTTGDLVLKTFSHQQAMTAVLAEHASLFGLRVKVLSRDEDDFPGGYHFHRKGGAFLREMWEGKRHPYIFHMSWTKSKDNKLLFLKQMGEWYLKDHCVAKKLSDINVEQSNFVKECCSKEAIITCHYKDKPSIEPCKDSPALDAGGKSFW